MCDIFYLQKTHGQEESHVYEMMMKRLWSYIMTNYIIKQKESWGESAVAVELLIFLRFLFCSTKFSFLSVVDVAIMLS